MYPSMHWVEVGVCLGRVSAWGGVVSSQGVCLPGGVCPGVSAQEGKCLPWRVTDTPCDRMTDRCKKHYLATTSLRAVISSMLITYRSIHNAQTVRQT